MTVAYVDYREPETIRKPLRYAGWEEAILLSGDYSFTSKDGTLILIERKSASDFIQSLHNGVLQRQCLNLVELTPYPTLLLEAFEWVDNLLMGYPGATRDTIESCLMSLQNLGCRLTYTRDHAATVHRVQWLKNEYYYKSVHTTAIRRVPGNRHLESLLPITGIGLTKAEAILTHFGNLSSIAIASLTDLQSVDSIGPKLAYNIYKHFHTTLTDSTSNPNGSN